MFALAGIFSLLVGVAGWYYAFYSPAAARLGGVESDSNNRLRIRLRRLNGVMMCLLAVGLFTGTAALERQWRSTAVAILWLAVILLLLAVFVLAMIDVKLTRHLRSELRRRQDGHIKP